MTLSCSFSAVPRTVHSSFIVITLCNDDAADLIVICHCLLCCVQKERKLLQVKRLDLDAAKTRLKKARVPDARAVVSGLFYCSFSFKTHAHARLKWMVI